MGVEFRSAWEDGGMEILGLLGARVLSDAYVYWGHQSPARGDMSLLTPMPLMRAKEH